MSGLVRRSRGGDVHVAWTEPLSRELHAWLGDMELDDMEKARVAALRRRDDRDGAATSRVLLKALVAAVCGVDPREVSLTYACPRCDRPHGQPVVAAPDAARNLHVSMSRTPGRVVVAASTAGPVGVDVERSRAASFVGFADIALTATERAALDAASQPERDAAQTIFWVRKEAILKATGRGLEVAATDVEVSPPHEPPQLIRWHGTPPTETPVRMRQIEVGTGYAACVAVLSGAPVPVRARRDVSVDGDRSAHPVPGAGLAARAHAATRPGAR